MSCFEANRGYALHRRRSRVQRLAAMFAAKDIASPVLAQRSAGRHCRLPSPCRHRQDGQDRFGIRLCGNTGRKKMSDRYAAYRRLKIDRPEERILRVMMDSPKRLNAADAAMHEELTHIWRDVDADPTVSAVIIRGAGEAFSAGGDLELVQEMTSDF